VAGGEQFHMEYFVSGMRTATRPTVYQTEIMNVSGCQGATHFVYGYNLGAFALGSYKAIGGEVGGTVWGIGAGGRGQHENTAEKRSGELGSCRGITAKDSDTCKAPIRLLLREIAAGDNPDVAAAQAPDTSESLNLAGQMKAEGNRMNAANELRQSAMQKMQARDGKGCISDLDAADSLDPDPGRVSNNPHGLLRIRGICIMLAGNCTDGKTAVRKGLQASMPHLHTEIIDRSVDSVLGNFCQGEQLSLRDTLIRAANDIHKTNVQKVEAKTCLSAYQIIKQNLSKLDPNDHQFSHIKAALNSATVCLANANDCDSAWKIYQSEFNTSNRAGFEAFASTCKGK